MNPSPRNPGSSPDTAGPSEPHSAPAGLTQWTIETELERLKNRLLRSELEQAAPTVLVALRRAANEAASLAWLEPFPLLAFPALFAELALAARRRNQKQERVRARSAEFAGEVA